MKSRRCLRLCYVLIGITSVGEVYADEPAAPKSIDGVYVVTSKDEDYVGRATVVRTQVEAKTATDKNASINTQTYLITWKLDFMDEPYSGVGLLRGSVLSASWGEGVALYDVTEDGTKLVGHYIGIDEPATKYDETWSFFRELTEEEKNVKPTYYDVDEIVAAYYEEDEDTNWYFAKVIKKCGEKYLVEFLDGSVQPRLLRADKLSRHKFNVGDTVYAKLEGAEEDGYFPLEVAAEAEERSDTATVTLQDGDGKQYKRELKFLRFEME